MEKGRYFTGVHGVDWAVGSGPNAFPVEMAGGNGGIGGTGALQAVLEEEAVGLERERGTGVEWGL
jgi:hypothetical protein